MALPLHLGDILNCDRAFAAEEGHENGQADGRLGRRDGEDEHGKNLARQIAEIGGEGHEIDIHGQQHQLDRHQYHNHILAIEENAEDAQREQRRAQPQKMCKSDL